MEFNRDKAFQLLRSTEPFPVDFDDATEWWNVQTRTGNLKPKGDLKKKLENNFIRGVDYFIPCEEGVSSFSENSEKPLNGRPREIILLTIECFKMMGMMVPGIRGRQIRQYFLDCESELKRFLEAERGNAKARLVNAFVSDQVLSRRSRFDDEFYELLYKKRGQGWEARNPKHRPSCVGTWTNQVVYDRFPDGVKDRLNEVNPRVDGSRRDKHHNHFKSMGSDHLDQHLPAVKAIARISPDGNWDRFMRNIQKGLPNGEPLQTSLLDLLEEYEDMDQVS
jgi:phage anti-repressor protein